MRLLLQKRPWDLVGILAYTGVLSVWILATGVGTLWALLLVLLCPGYVLVAALFPGRGLLARIRTLGDEGETLRAAARSYEIDLAPHHAAVARARAAAQGGRLTEAVAVLEAANGELRRTLDKRWARSGKGRDDAAPPWASEDGGSKVFDWTERLTLSFGLSIALVSLLGLLLNLTPFGIRLDSIVAIILIFTLAVGTVAIRRRMALPVEDRLSVDLRRERPAGPPSTALDKALAVALAASIIFAIAVVAYVAITPRPQEQFTQFFLLDRNGTVDPDLYPFRLNVSEPGAVIIVIINNETVHADYVVRVDLVGVEIVKNATSGLNVTLEVNRSTLATFSLSLENRGMWREPFTFTIAFSGLWELDFLLFRTGNFPSPYKHTYFYTNVTAPG